MRERYIDLMRGGVMILVVLGHHIGFASDPINKFILSFHMPAFFFISGMLAQINPNIGNKEYWGKSYRRFKNLFKRYITWSILGVLFYWSIMVPAGRDIATLSQSLIGIFISDDVIGKTVTLGFWMVLDLLYVIILYFITLRLVKKDYLVMFIAFGALMFVYYLVDDRLRFITRPLIGYFFFSFGAFAKRRVNMSIMFGHKYMPYGIMFILFASTIILSQVNTGVQMFIRDYGIIWVFLLSSITGSLLCWFISYKLQNNKLLEYIGRNTPFVLFYSSYILLGMGFVCTKVFGKTTTHDYPWNFVSCVVNITLCVFLCLFWNKIKNIIKINLYEKK